MNWYLQKHVFIKLPFVLPYQFNQPATVTVVLKKLRSKPLNKNNTVPFRISFFFFFTMYLCLSLGIKRFKRSWNQKILEDHFNDNTARFHQFFYTFSNKVHCTKCHNVGHYKQENKIASFSSNNSWQHNVNIQSLRPFSFVNKFWILIYNISMTHTFQ